MTTDQAAKLTGVSERQLQWWDENNVVSPRMVGHKREYSIDQATVLAFVLDLRRSGVCLETARKVARRFENFPTAQWAIVHESRVIFTDGPVRVAQVAAETAGAVVVVQIRRFTEADVPPAKQRKRRHLTVRSQGVTVAESSARRSAGMLTPAEASLTRAALSTERGAGRDYRTPHDVLVARQRDLLVGG